MFHSRFTRDASILVVLNFFSRAISFFGSTYAAWCLGPANLGVSALIQTGAAQSALLYNGGFDIVASRAITRTPSDCPRIGSAVLGFRLIIAALSALAWILVISFFSSSSYSTAWYLGCMLLLISASSLSFAFQGLEKLPYQAAISAVTALFTAFCYYALFIPGMPPGADLAVVCGSGLLTAFLSFLAFRRCTGQWPFPSLDLQTLKSLLSHSWIYWILAVAIFFYSAFQIQLVDLYLGPHDAGIYRSAMLFASALELLFGSVSSLFLPRMVTWHHQGISHMWGKQLSLLPWVVLVGAPVTLVAVLAAPYLFPLFLGLEFSASVPVFQILAVSRFAVFAGQVFAYGLPAAGFDRHFAWISIIGAAVSISMSCVLLPRLGVIGASITTLVVECGIHLSFFIVLWRSVRQRENPGLSIPKDPID